MHKFQRRVDSRSIKGSDRDSLRLARAQKADEPYRRSGRIGIWRNRSDDFVGLAAYRVVDGNVLGAEFERATFQGL